MVDKLYFPSRSGKFEVHEVPVIKETPNSYVTKRMEATCYGSTFRKSSIGVDFFLTKAECAQYRLDIANKKLSIARAELNGICEWMIEHGEEL